MRALSVVLCLAATILPLSSAEPDSLLGFAPDSVKTQRDWEMRFRALPKQENLRAYMQRLSARPHHLGSPYAKDNAEWILAKFKEWGLDAKIEAYDVLFPTPRERVLEMVSPVRFTAKLDEPALSEDPTSSQKKEQLPTYNAYSADGDVTAPLVYVNFGTPSDYEKLEELGVSVQGAIVIARYGQSFRGIKVKVAAEHGAVGCIIYSDPHEDGYFDTSVYPEGPNRPKDGVQRGSVMDIATYPGDPLTPGVASVPGTPRIQRSQAETITKIPVLPISYADAQPLLAALQGRVAPAAWRGALPITYHLGPGPARVHLKVSFDWTQVPAYDVIARIPGAVEPDSWIIRGNHHDAWVNGAADPIAGLVPLMEEARGVAELMKQGWRPRRTIIFAAWDGEEEGLIGSTEWAEAHASELTDKAAVYINTDGNGRGFLNVSGSHTLEKLMNEVARDIEDPETKLPVARRLRLRRIATAGNTADRQEARSRPDLRIGALGSGSDYTAFLDHFGIASLNLGFGGEGEDNGTYHSIYDTFYWYTHFVDTDFAYGKALAQTAGTTVLRLADAELLPLDFGNFTDTLRRYIDELKRLETETRDQIVENNRRIDEGIHSATDDPRQKTPEPRRESTPPFLNFAPLENGFVALQTAASQYGKVQAQAIAGSSFAKAELKDANQKLIAIERSLTLRDGLPNRPWYRHQIYAPGYYTGYGVKTLPGVRESIEQKQWRAADEQIVRVGKVLEAAGESIASAGAALQRATR